MQTQLRERDSDVERVSHQLTRVQQRLEAETGDKNRLNAALAQASEEILRMEHRLDRVAALEAAHATALAQGEQQAQARIDALLAELGDAEAALAKLRRQHRASAWKRLTSRLRNHRLGNTLVRAALFDAEWYLREYSAIVNNGQAPVEHYLEEGYLRGLRPNQLFDTRWYLQQYEDVRRAGVNPLVHYFRHGHLEHSKFRSAIRHRLLPDIQPRRSEQRHDPLSHYLRHGRHEGRLPRRPGTRLRVHFVASSLIRPPPLSRICNARQTGRP